MSDSHFPPIRPMKENSSGALPPVLSRYRWPLVVAVGVLGLAVAWIARRDAASPAPREAGTVATPDSIITLDSTTQRLAGIELVTAGAGGGNALVANGTITFDANRVSVVASHAPFPPAGPDLRSALARLSAIGATDAGGGQGASFGLASPIAGVVVERNASPGQPVGPSTNLFTVADLRNVWITVDVYENDLSRVRRGVTAFVTPAAFSSERFPGRVTYAGGVVDTASRTFKVRVEVANPNLRLRPGMFAQVHIPTPGTPGTGGPVAIPEIAVQEVNGREVVFVASALPGQFIVRPVTLGLRRGGTVAITSGLAAGERIVVKGAFQIKAELMKASFGEGE